MRVFSTFAACFSRCSVSHTPLASPLSVQVVRVPAQHRPVPGPHGGRPGPRQPLGAHPDVPAEHAVPAPAGRGQVRLVLGTWGGRWWGRGHGFGPHGFVTAAAAGAGLSLQQQSERSQLRGASVSFELSRMFVSGDERPAQGHPIVGATGECQLCRSHWPVCDASVRGGTQPCLSLRRAAGLCATWLTEGSACHGVAMPAAVRAALPSGTRG